MNIGAFENPSILYSPLFISSISSNFNFLRYSDDLLPYNSNIEHSFETSLISTLSPLNTCFYIYKYMHYFIIKFKFEKIFTFNFSINSCFVFFDINIKMPVLVMRHCAKSTILPDLSVKTVVHVLPFSKSIKEFVLSPCKKLRLPSPFNLIILLFMS